MIAAISANPMSFKVWKLMRFGTIKLYTFENVDHHIYYTGKSNFTVLFVFYLAAIFNAWYYIGSSWQK